MTVSVIIPACNEEESIEWVVKGLKSVLGGNCEILVVDDGSTDRTSERAEGAGAGVLRLDGNRGKGVALRKGIEVARGNFIVTMDGDGQDDPGDLPRLLDAAREGADLVIGSRFLGTLHPGAISPLNASATRFFNLLINLLYSASITDSQAGYRCFRSELVKRLHSDVTEYEIETEMLIRALKAGGRVTEVPVSRFPRKGGASSFSRIRHGLRILSRILKHKIT